VKDGDQYRYLDQDGVALTGWQTIGGYRYYLDPQTSARVTGIQSIDGKLYVLSARGVRYNGTRLVETSKGQCFVTKDGSLATGWVQYNNNWYYFKQNGLMKTGKLVLDGKTYWLGKDGVMRTGWYRGNGYLYYLDRKTGAAAVGWKQLSGRKYLFSRNGVMRKGWYKPTGRMFYMGKDGYVLSGLKKIGTAKYYLRLDGAITNGSKKIGKYWYYFKSCKACTGWLTLGSQKYYLTQNGVMVTGTHTIDGVSYSFAPDGALRPSTNNYHNTEEFIACIAPLVQKYAPKYGVKVVSPIIAQAILESASGESSLGKKYNNFFGLKCGTLWTGKSVNLLTGEEYTVGHYTTITAAFRVYDNMEEGVKGYFEFLFRNRTRYNNLIGETDPYRYLEKIKADGYATSSQYVTNTYNVLKRYNLTRFDRK
jgi:glucan-binding YG repeat protein